MPGNTKDSLKLKVLNQLASYLASRDHSKAELHNKLSKKFKNNELIVTWAIEKAESNNWITDEHELAQKVFAELNRKGKSIYSINTYLNKKGLPLVSTTSEAEEEKALGVLKKKFKDFPNLSKEDKEKASRHLNYKGFSQETIREIIYENKRS